MVESLPTVIKTDLSNDDMEELKAKLEGLKCTLEIS